MMAVKIVMALATLTSTAQAALFRGGDAKHILPDGSEDVKDRTVIRKSKSDARRYEYNEFPSGLKVMVIQDESMEKVAFANAVQVGSWEDPSDFPGLAHFCEHMVFMNSKKYPEENLADKILTSNGGYTNAWTSTGKTVYSGIVTEHAFEQAFDVWSRFFIDPSFLRNSTGREINAVNAEWELNKDPTRLPDIALRDIANPKSPVRKFVTGNKEYLKTRPNDEGKSTIEALKKFFEKHYCAPRMHLVIMGKADPEELFSMAHRSFDALEEARNKEKCQKVRPQYFDIPAYSKKLGNLGKSIKLYADTPYLQLHFPLMPLNLGDRYKTLPETYVQIVFGEMGRGSLNERLRAERLIYSMEHYIDSTLAGTNLALYFELTEKGIENMESIVAYVVAYVKVMRQDGIEEAFLKKIKQHMQVVFDYAEQQEEPEMIVENVASSLATPAVKPEDALTNRKVWDKIDLNEINKLMDDIRTDNMNIIITSNEFTKDAATNYDDVYDFHFRVESIGEDFQKRVEDKLQKESYFESFKKPSASNLEYVPSKLNLTTDRTVDNVPELLEDKNGAALWWLGPGTSKLPQAKIIVEVKYPISAMRSVQSQVLRHIHNIIVDRAADEEIAGMEEAGIVWNRMGRLTGNTFTITGFDEYLHTFTERVLSGVKDLALAEEVFKRARQQFDDELGTGKYGWAPDDYEAVMVTGGFRAVELADVIWNDTLINYEEYSKWVGDVYGSSDLTVICAGNYGKDRSKTTMSMIRSLLKSDSWGILDWIKKIFKFFSSESAASPKMPKPQQKITTSGLKAALKPKQDLIIQGHGFRRNISQTLVVYQFGIPQPKHRVYMKILSPIVDNLVFRELRTERQLSYSTGGHLTIYEDVMELRMDLEGSKKTPDEIADLMEELAQNMTTDLEKMSQKEFNARKIALQTALQAPAAHLDDWVYKFQDKITEKSYCFNMEEQMLKYMESKEFSSPSVLVDFWKKLVAPSKTRKKVVTKLYGTNLKKPKKKYESGEPRLIIDLDEIDRSELDEFMSGMVEEWPQQYICEAK
eukprot:TRINITY_DN7246_c0_g1_i1.p1 TRINITY_DN7246_c0_g1~~TRINITY_DN7246_c0_g1_i1.p1  ORF type:complete len:1041 (+),score=210.54 TRINITY_DN7246_c0_g1_i1:127-3249(+)